MIRRKESLLYDSDYNDNNSRDGLVLPTGKISEDRTNHLFLLLKNFIRTHTCATTFGTR